MAGPTTEPQADAPTLADLHRESRLAAEYPEATRLVAGLHGRELLRAGQLLARLGPDAVLREHPTVPTMTVALTGHGTVAQLVPPLTAELARHGILLRPYVAPFDSYVFDLSDPGSELYTSDPDIVLCVLDPAVVFDEVPTPWRPSDVERVAGEKVRLLERLVTRFQSAARGTLVLNTLPLPRHFAAQVVDHRSRALLGAIWREANTRLLRLTEDHPGVVVLDLDPLVAEGVPARDPRLDAYAGAHLSPDLLAGYAREVGHLARHVAGRAKKCLVLDLDNTVWGGTLGDDGLDGIEVAGGHRGEAFRTFQQVAKQIGSQGVLLAAVSKNDLDAVREVLRDHPRMTLREEDFVRVVANWRPKHENLAELAETLNLNVDSFVFVDDSAYECGLVRHGLPGVTVVQVDEEPALHAEALLRDGWFDTPDLTAEDRARVSRYRDELVRKDFLHSFESVDDYLAELKVKVRLAAVTGPDIPRVAQLTLRTNQFNLTTRRLQQADVRSIAEDPAGVVLAVHASDRFGDNGTVGAVFARHDGDALHIDNFLLSCRVFSRGIEQACLSSVLRHARTMGVTAVYGTYRPTAKNGVVREFYPRYGFERVSDDGTMILFRHDLADIITTPGHVDLTEDLEGKSS
jgi:FkbH-like protein